MKQLLPLFHFFFISVPLAEITCRMVANSVWNGLDQNRFLFSDDKFSCLLSGVINCKDVVAIDSDCVHAVSNSSYCDTVTSILVVNGSWNCVHIVSAEEHCLAPESSCEIHCWVKIAFWCWTVSEVGNSNSILVFYSKLVSCSWGLWDLSTERRRHSNKIDFFASIMDRHLPTFTDIKMISC